MNYARPELSKGSGNDSRLGSLDSPVLGGVKCKEHPAGIRRPPSGVPISGLSSPRLGPFHSIAAPNYSSCNSLAKEFYRSEASPFPPEARFMSGIDDLLLYPLATGDQPICPKCCSPLVLVGFQGGRGMPDFPRFRCPDCGRSETLADDEHRSR